MRRIVARYCLVAALFAAGLLAKPMVVTVPLVLLLLDWWPLSRKEPLTRLVWEKVPLLALSALVWVAQQPFGPNGRADRLPPSINCRLDCGFPTRQSRTFAISGKWCGP